MVIVDNNLQHTQKKQQQKKELSSRKELDGIARQQAEDVKRQQEELERAAKDQAEQAKRVVLQDLSERAKSYKPRWDKNGIIQFKKLLLLLPEDGLLKVKHILLFSPSHLLWLLKL